MRCAFEVYRVFEKDAEGDHQLVRENGKRKVPTVAFSGEMSRHREEAKEMFSEAYERILWSLVSREHSALPCG
jgi:hypothetical protein